MGYNYPFDSRKMDAREVLKLWARGLAWGLLAFGLFVGFEGWRSYRKGGFLYQLGEIGIFYGAVMCLVAILVLVLVSKAKLPKVD